MDLKNPEEGSYTVTTDKSNQQVEGRQVNIGGDVVGGDVVVGDSIGGDKIGGDKISADVVVSGPVAGDVQITYMQRAPVPPPPLPLRPPDTAHFVGREAELAAYSAALDQNGIAVINGFPGMGKTALAAELARRTARPEKIFWHSFHEEEGVESIFWRLAAFLAANGQGAVWAMLQNAVLANSHPVPPLMLSDYLVEEVRNKGFLLCLDDFQNVDGSSLHNQFVERIQSLLAAGELKLIITSREALAFGQPSIAAALGGLRTADFNLILSGSDIYLEEDQITRLHQYTGGNAQMLTMVIDLLGDEAEAEVLLDQLVEVDNLEDFLMDEIESRLTRSERLVMRAVSILQGYPGRRTAVEAVLAGDRLRRVLRDLSDRFLLTVSRAGGVEVYNQHDIVRDFFYEGINLRERKRMHLRAAEYYRDEEPDPLLAIRHFLSGGTHGEAAALAEDNYYRLLNQGQASALDHLLTRIDRDQVAGPQWIAVQLVSGQVNNFLGESDQARDNYQDAMDELSRLTSSLETAELQARIALGYGEMLVEENPAAAAEWLRRGLEGYREKDSLLSASLYLKLGESLHKTGKFEEAHENIQESLSILPEEPIQLRMQALRELGVSTFYAYDLDEAAKHTEESLVIGHLLQDQFEVAGLLSNLGMIRFEQGEFSEGIAAFEEARDLLETLGAEKRLADIEFNLGHAYGEVGDTKSAQAHLHQSLALGLKTGNKLTVIRSHGQLADIFRKEAQLEKAREHAQKALQLSKDQESDLALNIWLLEVAAEIALALGDLDTARDCILRSLHSMGQDGGLDRGFALNLLGRIQVAAGELQDARATFEESMVLLEEDGQPLAGEVQASYDELLANLKGGEE